MDIEKNNLEAQFKQLRDGENTSGAKQYESEIFAGNNLYIGELDNPEHYQTEELVYEPIEVEATEPEEIEEVLEPKAVVQAPSAVSKEEDTKPELMVKELEVKPNISFEELRKQLGGTASKSDQAKEIETSTITEHKLNFTFLESWNDYFTQFKDKFVFEGRNLNSFSEQSKFKGGKAKVLFVGDTFDPETQGEEDDLLAKMITAMKLDTDEYLRVFYDPSFSEEDYFLAFFQEIVLLEPDYIVSMGATMTNLLLQKQTRLSKVHGNFYPIKIADEKDQELSFELIPIFHPEYLRINPSMKKNTWEDLQKLMKRLGKS